ncbi:MAG: hypothetical protein U0X93_17500 [Anaerolineales bacterium]
MRRHDPVERIFAHQSAPHLASKFHLPEIRTNTSADDAVCRFMEDGDALFVTAWAEPAFRYYAPFYGSKVWSMSPAEDRRLSRW